MKKMLVAALILPVALLGAARPAKASDTAAAIFVGVVAGVGAALLVDALVPHPVVAAPVYEPAPVVVPPPPVVYQPAPVIVQPPPPVVYQPAPVFVTPAPVIYQRPVIVKHPRHVVYAPAPAYVPAPRGRGHWVAPPPPAPRRDLYEGNR